MKNITFFAVTEYHLYLSLQIYLSFFRDSKRYQVTMLYPEKSYRFKMSLNFNGIDVDVVKYGTYPELNKEKIRKIILKEQIHDFFTFNEDDHIYTYVIEKLFRKKTKIHLVQDGLKPYVKHEISFFRKVKQIFKTTLLENYKLLSKKMFLNELISINSFKYASSGKINKLWFTHPNSYNNTSKIENVKIPELEGNHVNLISRIFRIDLADNFEKREQVIFYIHQALFNDDVTRLELKTLKALSEWYSSTKILVKIHPSASPELLKQFRSIPNVVILNQTIPAELYIINLKKSIILSPYSAALITLNSSCNYYYLFDLLKIRELIGSEISNFSFDHITMCKSIKEIQFPC